MKIIKRRQTRQHIKNIAITFGIVAVIIACDMLMSLIAMA